MSTSNTITTWKLRPGADRRIRSQHPWVFSNELAQSPKGHSPGAPVRLLDAKGQFVASGYGNPHSLISFRALGFDPHQENPADMEEILEAVISSWGHRSLLGYEDSFRLVYGEGDFLPGLVIDRYVVENDGRRAQIFACQILTAGMDLALQATESFFQRLAEEAHQLKLSDFNWLNTAVVLRNDVQIRRLEGLQVEEPRLIKNVQGFDFRQADIVLAAALGGEPLLMTCDLIEGQKTGFFLDQAYNIAVLCRQIQKMTNLKSPVRILDLCCYVGQWSAQISRALGGRGLKAEVTAVDASETALAFAEKNIARACGLPILKCLDVLEGLAALPDKHYDIVIADPPAFIKAKKDVPTGRHAYLKLNTQAFRLVKRGGLVVSCSCSGLFEESEMMEVIRKSIARMDLRARCLARGGHAPDHPNLMSFPEGFYLKMFLHQVVFR